MRHAIKRPSRKRITVHRSHKEVRVRFRDSEVLSLRNKLIRSKSILMTLREESKFSRPAGVADTRTGMPNRLSVSRVSYLSVRAEAMRCDICSTAQHGTVHYRQQHSTDRFTKSLSHCVPMLQSRRPSDRVYLPCFLAHHDFGLARSVAQSAA